MSTTPAERMRKKRIRDRKHAANDHSMCIPGNCSAITTEDPVTGVIRVTTAGERLVADLRKERVLSAAEVVLAETAGHLTDRIADLRGYLEGRPLEWLSAALVDMGEGVAEVRVSVDSVVSEVRQQEATLKAVLGELRQHGIAAARASARGSNTPATPVQPPTVAPAAPAAPAMTDDDGDLFATG